MSVLWKEIEFYKGRSYCKAIVTAVWDLGRAFAGFQGATFFWLFNIFKVFKQLTMTSKKTRFLS